MKEITSLVIELLDSTLLIRSVANPNLRKHEQKAQTSLRLKLQLK